MRLRAGFSSIHAQFAAVERSAQGLSLCLQRVFTDYARKPRRQQYLKYVMTRRKVALMADKVFTRLRLIAKATAVTGGP